MRPQSRHPLELPIRSTWLNRLAVAATGLTPLAALYDDWLEAPRATGVPVARQFLDFTLDRMNASLHWSPDAPLREVPDAGPLLVVANHPLGCLEGMLLTRELLRHRPDTKVLANELLLRFPEFAEVFIGVDVLSRRARQRNSRGIRAACRHLQNGGSLLVFPAGTVSTINLLRRRIEDRPWSHLVGQLQKRYRTACLTVHVDARNRIGFYLAGLVSRRLRTALLPRELANKRDYVMTASAGEVLRAREAELIGDATDITRYLRLGSELLGARSRPAASRSEARVEHPVAADVDLPLITQQLVSLRPYCLLQDGPFAVYCAPYAGLGPMLQQIAIERERTFRAAGEGTGRELDSDGFDPHYWHLWAWDHDAGRLVGGYRIGRVDAVVREHGLEGLYSRSLYRFDPRFLAGLDSAVEVGRSFVTLAYQRHPRALDLLWRGIGSFIARNPGYHTLFGCVSISGQYSRLARAFLADALLQNFGVTPELRAQVRPQNPLRIAGRNWKPEMLAQLGNVAIINKLLGHLDTGKRIPILLRHYLALNGRFASFTVNDGFNDSLDGLIFVDLRQAPRKYLKRYLGADGANQFLHYWSGDVRAA